MGVTTEALERLMAGAIASADPTLEERIVADPSAYLTLVDLAAHASRYSNDLLRSAVESARSAGHSWEAIGVVLGISRQAAQQRFASTTAPRLARLGPDYETLAAPGYGQQLLLAPLTVFNEMRVLERVGRYGWHSIGYGPFYHVVMKSARRWEHARVFALTASRRAPDLGDAGWIRIGESWFPWAYYKRELDEPALFEPPGWDPLRLL